MTTEEAFKELITNKEYLSTLPIDQRNLISAYKSLYKKKKLKFNNIDSLLQKHGYKKISGPIWEKKIQL